MIFLTRDMLFNSLAFLVFFIVVTPLYYAVPPKYRWLHIVISGAVFYTGVHPEFLLVIGGLVVANYCSGLLIKASGKRWRWWVLCMSSVVNIGLLALYKYAGFIAENMLRLLPGTGLHAPDLLLPLGLSFHVLQMMAYNIEVYRGNQAPERHPGVFAAYVFFYPQMVAGPIERPQQMLPQFREMRTFDWSQLEDGLLKMLWGFFKKIVIADRIGLLVDSVYSSASPQGPEVVTAALLYSIQVYCDFSGYTDIALGAAETMGVRLTQNFNKPLFATSIADFWRRWHISLSTWLRDYIYVPLGGRAEGNRLRTYLNLMIVFLISGLWHGANWTFVIWGALHGLFIVAGSITKNWRSQFARFAGVARRPALNITLSIIATYLLVAGSRVFFRAPTINKAVHMYACLFNGWGLPGKTALIKFLAVLGSQDPLYGLFNLAVAILLTLFLLACEYGSHQTVYPLTVLKNKTTLVRWGAYSALIILLFLIGVYENKAFIYYQY